MNIQPNMLDSNIQPDISSCELGYHQLDSSPQLSHPFSEPRECYCLVLFMCPQPSSLELCFMIA